MNNKQHYLQIKHYNWQLFVVLLLSLMIFANPSYAQSAGDICKAKMIENINKGDFATALQYITCVKDWSFEPQNPDLWFHDISPVLDFESYADSMGVAEELCDTVLLYLIAQCDVSVQVFYSQGKYEKALAFAKLTAVIAKEVWGEEDSNNYVTLLTNFGAIYTKMGNYAEAEKYYIEALRIQKVTLGEKHPNYATSLNKLGLFYYDMGEYTNAETYFLEALQIRKSVLGKKHIDYVGSLNNLGLLYSDMGKFSKAEEYYMEALLIYKSMFGIQHPKFAVALNNFGTLYCKKGWYKVAEDYYTKALQIQKASLSNLHPDYVGTLKNLGIMYRKQCAYAKAEPYYLELLQIQKTILEKQHPDYLHTLNDLGKLYHDMSDYTKAEQYYLEILQIHKSIFKEQHPAYADLLNSIGTLYKDIGDYTRAEEYYAKALQFCKSVLSEQCPEYAVSLNNIGLLYMNMGDYTKAGQNFIEALEIQASIFGKYHPDYIISLNNLGFLSKILGNYALSEEYYEASLEMNEYIFGEHHPEYATALNNMGMLYFDMGDYKNAERYFIKAMKIRKSKLGKWHSDFAISVNNLGLLYQKQDSFAKAEPYIHQTIQIDKKKFIESTDYMTERQREKYWSTMQNSFYQDSPCFSYFYSTEKPSISTFAYDNELFSKGLLLNLSNSVRSSILESGDTTLIRQWNELTAKKQQIQVLEEKDPQSEYLKQVQTEAEQLEKQVTQSSAAFRESKARWAISWDSVRNHLADNEVAIEYFVAPLSEDTAMYCALLLRHDSEYPALVPLFEEKEVAALVNVSTGNQTNFTYSYDAYGEEICHRVWDKIQPYVHEGETIYFSPAGLLHQLAIEALPYDENHTLADVYHMVRLSSTREIAMRHTASKHSTATLYGGIEYDMTDTELLAASSPYQQTNLLASRGIDNDTLNRGNVQYLEGTLHEVENIYSMLVGNRLHRIKAQLYKAKAGNEESFKSLSGKRQNILHIATHGFFWTDAVAQRKELFTQRSLMMSFDGNQHTPPTIDPLTRCGLLLAGANTALSGHSADLPKGVQDGILTAKEISLMDLREADLVVLSACETGRGEITSEGVFGLQRAFKQAGVQTIVMSLWKVSDVATQLLMTEFYRNWLTLGQAKREAFLNAQNTVRQQYPNPEFWAGFVMID